MQSSTPGAREARRTPIERALIRRALRLMPPERRRGFYALPASTRKMWEDMTISASWRQLDAMAPNDQCKAVDQLAREDRAARRPIVPPTSPVRKGSPRRRGAGRPRVRTATRSSARSGDSGDDDPAEPQPLSAAYAKRDEQLALDADAAEGDWGRCPRCGRILAWYNGRELCTGPYCPWAGSA